MATFSISDVILGLKKESATLLDNWQGETADSYISRVMSHYIEYAVAIEKCLQSINEELESVRENLEDNPGAYQHSSKKYRY